MVVFNTKIVHSWHAAQGVLLTIAFYLLDSEHQVGV
jgi:hypothetical protein